MLITPIGNISVAVDNKEIDYQAIKVENDSNCPDVDGRYKIIIHHDIDYLAHTISCSIKNVDYCITKIGAESGERLEALAFYQNDIKLTIGTEGWECHGSGDYDYDYGVTYLKNGISCDIFPNTETNVFVFGVSWITDCSDENDAQTWYGADPTCM